MKKVNPHQLKYQNITVSGRICTGTSTLANLLVKTLGWTSWSGGEFFRNYCRQHNLEFEKTTLRPDDISRQVDYGMRQRLQKETSLILEAWLSGFVAQGIKGVLKVLLVCTDDLRIDRYVNRERVSVDQALADIKKREDENFKKWKRVYQKEWQQWVVKPGTIAPNQPIDFYNPKLYDLVIDTYSHSREETLKQVLKKLGYYASKTA